MDDPTERCSTCRHLRPAIGAWDAECGHPDDDVASVLFRSDDATLVIHKPDEFGCTRWEPQP